MFGTALENAQWQKVKNTNGKQNLISIVEKKFKSQKIEIGEITLNDKKSGGYMDGYWMLKRF